MSEIVFDARQMMASAAGFTGLDDFGGDDFVPGLEALLQTYDSIVVEEAGRSRLYNRVLKLLAARLRVRAAQKRLPEVNDLQLAKPVVLTGLPRTGTSALFNLFSQDPAARALLQWETHYPDPMEGLAPGEMDPRHQKLIDKIEAQRAMNPDFDKVHFASADTPEECVLLHAMDFNGVQLGFECLVEPYMSHHQNSDLGPMYRYYLSLLKLLQWRNPGERWFLKAPAHMWGLDALIDVMPDVCILWGHRDPLQVVPSIASLIYQAGKMYGGDIPALAKPLVGPMVLEFYARSLERGLALRAKLDSQRFLDYAFSEFVDDPAGLVARSYAYFGLPYDDAMHEAFARYIAANPKGKHGKHEYSYEEYGVSEAAIKSRFAFYYQDERFKHML